MDSEFLHVPQHYQVNVCILEGRHLAMTSASTTVKVSIGGKTKTIRAKSDRTDCPHYNDFCVFLFRRPLSVLLDEMLIISVFQKPGNRRKKLVGSFSVELTTVWSQPNHQFYHKWAMLVDPKNPTGEMKGLLKCDIAILARGVVVKPPCDHEENGVLEDNLLVPHGGTSDRQRIRVILSVFRADSFSPYYSKKCKMKISRPFVRVTYGGDVRSTKVAKNKRTPVWNQELSFVDLFPPLSQNILVEMCSSGKGRKSLGNTNIEMNTLYEDGADGFLPTFGPNFLYLYHPLKKFKRHRDYCAMQNSFTYMGRVLLALRTEMIEYPEDVKVLRRRAKTSPLKIPPLVETVYFEYNKFILFAAIFDILFFDANYSRKNVIIRLSMGPRKNPRESEVERKAKRKGCLPRREEKGTKCAKHVNVMTRYSTTSRQRCIAKEDYSFITFSGKFPCIHVYSEWPDSLSRVYQSNVIKKAIQNCTDNINKIKYELKFHHEKRSESSQKLKATLAELSKNCEVILLSTNVTAMEDTNLCRQRKGVNCREIAEIAYKARLASNQDALKAEDELIKISSYLARLTKYAQNPENSFPDTEIWLLSKNKVIAQYRMRTEDLAFSDDFNKRGVMSGKPQTILIRGKKEKIKAKLDIFLWFGLAEDFMHCIKMLPNGMNQKQNPCGGSTALAIPSQLVSVEEHYFQCRAHIFQGKIMFGYDRTELADPYIRVIILGQNKKTQVRTATLSPIWDETLVFPLITLYGPPDYLRDNPVTITVEVFDHNRNRKSELIGRSFVTPLLKLKDEKYEPPRFPPKLRWEEIYSEIEEVGRVLMATELLEHSETLKNVYAFGCGDGFPTLSIPQDIRPHNVTFRLEIMFWGVRQLRQRKLLKNTVFVLLECGGRLIRSPVLHNARQRLNFSNSVHVELLQLPEEPEYAPALSLKLYHIASLSRQKVYVATCIVPSVRPFMLESERERENEIHIQIVQECEKNKKVEEEESRKCRWLRSCRTLYKAWERSLLVVVKTYRSWRLLGKWPDSAYCSEVPEEKLTWWLKYYSSIDQPKESPEIPTIKVYHEELEVQPDFKGFSDVLHTFDMTSVRHGRKKDPVLKAKVKAVVKLHKCSHSNLKHWDGILSKRLSNEPVKFLARVYVIHGHNLTPKGVCGKADPYLLVQLGNHCISDRKHYVRKQINPVFGRCFELHGIFPRDYLLRVKVIDYDASAKDDLIGQTSIDLENRYYSRYHARCGLSEHFDKHWRDMYPPTEILNQVCKHSSLPYPVYQPERVFIGNHEFATPVSSGERYRDQVQALMVLKRWHEMPLKGFHLVPEHVERRSLYHPSFPGIEQGKLEMWVDIFPADYSLIPSKVDVTPSTPVAMELRAIVWNVVDVVLDDRSLICNGKISDIYVKGWIQCLEEEMQKTDIHYRCLNGEGNFNWRFIFHFDYMPMERRMTVRKKVDPFDQNPEERKVQCKLEIQVCDNDTFGADYLGTLILELCSMPRGAKLSNTCTLKMLAPNAGKINLFKIRKTRGWWPFRRRKEKRDNEFELSGKIDLELEILTKAEATEFPAGKGRKEPNCLPLPDRPGTSFNWMLNPFKAFRYIIWRRISRTLVKWLLIILLIIFVLVAIYAFPHFMVRGSNLRFL